MHISPAGRIKHFACCNLLAWRALIERRFGIDSVAPPHQNSSGRSYHSCDVSEQRCPNEQTKFLAQTCVKKGNAVPS